jgi:hypothetical protein
MKGVNVYRYVPLLFLLSVALAAQTPSATVKPKSPLNKWTLPRTADGHPDLQGVWTNASRVPLERPRELGTKEFYTEEEAAENVRKGLRGDRPTVYAEVQYDLSQFGLETAQQTVAPSLRTSLITGPDGRIPPMTPQALKRAAEFNEKTKGHEYDGPENRSLQERCILGPDAGPPMLPMGYNSNLQIVQSADTIAITQEMIHDYRIIPLDKRSHLPASVRQRRGDPRGYWEGDTLVVESTNFRDQIPIRSRTDLVDRKFGYPVTNLHVIERFTRTGPDTILYEFTVEDPDTWVRPWKGEVPLARLQTPVYEYACHEGNYGMPNIISGIRAAEEQQSK